MRRINRISITNLFGMFDYDIPLNMNERITIIHGPNGFGKTSILRLLNELFHKSSTALKTIPFNELRVELDDDSCFWVVKNFETTSKKKGIRSSPPELTFHFTTRNGE